MSGNSLTRALNSVTGKHDCSVSCESDAPGLKDISSNIFFYKMYLSILPLSSTKSEFLKYILTFYK